MLKKVELSISNILKIIYPHTLIFYQREWRIRHLRGREKGKEDVGVEKEREKEERKGEKMESFFCSIYEFLKGKSDVTNSLCNNLPSAEYDAAADDFVSQLLDGTMYQATYSETG